MSVPRGRKILRVLKNFINEHYSDVLEVEDVRDGILIKIRNGNSGGSP